jgi:hypothetical protein
MNHERTVRSILEEALDNLGDAAREAGGDYIKTLPNEEFDEQDLIVSDDPVLIAIGKAMLSVFGVLDTLPEEPPEEWIREHIHPIWHPDEEPPPRAVLRGALEAARLQGALPSPVIAVELPEIPSLIGADVLRAKLKADENVN